MVFRFRPLTFISIMAASTLALACSEDGDDGGRGVGTSLELFSWWTEAGEAEALDALLGVFNEEYPDVSVVNAAAADPTNARTRLSERMDAGEPPDTFQAISGVDLLTLVAQGKMSPITDLAEANQWEEAFPKALLDILSIDGELYGVPVNIERDNNLYYNMQVFSDAKMDPPKTLDEFYVACEAFQDNDVTPLAVPAAGWVLALVGFETLMPAVVGGEYYEDFFSGKADVSGPELTQFFEEFKKVLMCSDVAKAEGSWTVNGDLMASGDAAMYVMGDWAKGYFEGGKDADGNDRDKLKPNVDFGVVPGLGSEGYFTFNSAVFGLPKGAQHPRAAEAFLEVVGSKAGQEAFNPVKGSVPARIDADYSLFDSMVSDAAADFKTAAAGSHRLLPGYASLTTFDYQVEVNPSLLVFAVGGARARELDPENVPVSEESVEALDVDYIVGKMAVTYSLLQD